MVFPEGEWSTARILFSVLFPVFPGTSLASFHAKNSNTSCAVMSSFVGGKFKDVSLDVGVGPDKYASGAVWLDIDADGDLDLYVTTMGDTRHYLYVNKASQVDQACNTEV